MRLACRCSDVTLLLSLLLLSLLLLLLFYSCTRKGFAESHLNCKTSIGPNSTQLPFLYVITQTLETVNVDLELDCLHLLKANFNNYT